MTFARNTYLTRNAKIIDFVIGFIGWIVLNVLIAVFVQFIVAGLSVAGGALDGGGSGVPDGMLIVIGLVSLCVPLVVNVGLLLFLALTRYWIALGAAAAFVLALVVGLCAGVFFFVFAAGMAGFQFTDWWLRAISYLVYGAC